MNRNETEDFPQNFKNFLVYENQYLIDNLLSCTLLLNQKQSVETELAFLDHKVPVTLTALVVPGSCECFIEIQDLSLQKKLNEVTAREHALYTLFEEASVGIFIADITGRYLSVNKFGCDMLGYSADEMVKMNIKDVLVPDDLKNAPIQMHEMLMGYRVITKRNMIRKDGKILPVEISGKVLSDGRLQGIVRDITAQIKAENALKASEQNYKHAESIAHLGSWQMDIRTGKSKWSDEFFRICGFEPQSFEPTRHMRFSVIHPDDRLLSERIIQQAIAEKKPYKLEKRVIRPSGEIRHILSVGEIILDSRNKPVELKGIFLDITDLKKIELSLKKSEENYRSLVEFLPIGLLIKNHRGDVLFGIKNRKKY
ncbi:MAG: PAS domain S-box protein [Bacteroidetes bacterium]|nr:PAS domain S-box protein [Bacteroidota bacterium]